MEKSPEKGSQTIVGDSLQESNTKQCELCSACFSIDQTFDHVRVCPKKLLSCPKCQTKHFRIILDKHMEQCYIDSQKQLCSSCGQKYIRPFKMRHDLGCNKKREKSFKLIEVSPVSPVDFKKFMEEVIRPQGKCIWCCQKQPSFGHQSQCFDYLQLKEAVKMMEDAKILTERQSKIIQYLHKKTAQSHCRSQPLLLKAIKEQGFTQADLLQIKNYLVEVVPINIHFRLGNCLKKFIKDGEYRNCFEVEHHVHTRPSYLSQRQRWQNYLFDSLYDKSAPHQRVKYGALNFELNPKGVVSCLKYGSSYIVLNHSVRQRCTITNKRTYGAGQILSTLTHSFFVLSQFTNKQLKALYHASKGDFKYWREITTFKEVHIHGPISFMRDVLCIYAPADEIKTNRSDVKEFVNKFAVPIFQI